MLLFSGLGLLGTFLSVGSRKLTPGKGKSLLLMAVLALLITGVSFTVGCGNYSNHQTPTVNHATVTVIGTSGAVSHSTPVTVTVQ